MNRISLLGLVLSFIGFSRAFAEKFSEPDYLSCWEGYNIPSLSLFVENLETDQIGGWTCQGGKSKILWRYQCQFSTCDTQTVRELGVLVRTKIDYEPQKLLFLDPKSGQLLWEKSLPKEDLVSTARTNFLGNDPSTGVLLIGLKNKSGDYLFYNSSGTFVRKVAFGDPVSVAPRILGKNMLWGFASGRLQLTDIEGKVIWTSENGYSVDRILSATEMRIVAQHGDEDSILRVLNAQSGATVTNLKRVTNFVVDEEMIVVNSGWDKTLVAYDVQTGKELWRTELPGEVKERGFSMNLSNKFLLTGGSYGYEYITLHEKRTGRLLDTTQIEPYQVTDYLWESENILTSFERNGFLKRVSRRFIR